MGNVEKLTTFGTQDTKQRQKKQNKHHNTTCVGHHNIRKQTHKTQNKT